MMVSSIEYRRSILIILLWCVWFAGAAESAPAEGADIPSSVPDWDARGTGTLPRQGIACLDVSPDGQHIAVGTIAPPGDPNVSADPTARALYRLDIELGSVQRIDLPDAVAGVATSNNGTVIAGCWNGRVYINMPDAWPPRRRVFVVPETTLRGSSNKR